MHVKRSAPDRGPLLPSEASTIVRVVAGLFGLGGVLTLLGLAAVVGAKLLGAKSMAEVPISVFGVVLLAAFGAAYCWTAVLLYAGRRLGAYIAIGALALNVLSLLLRQPDATMRDYLIPVAALIGLAFAWPHLSAGGREVDEHVSIRPRAG